MILGCSTYLLLLVRKITKILLEILPGCFWSLRSLDSRVRVDDKCASLEEVIDVEYSLINVTFNVHGEPGSFWNRQSEEEGNDTRDTAKAYEDTPHQVHGVLVEFTVRIRVFETSDSYGSHTRCDCQRTSLDKIFGL